MTYEDILYDARDGVAWITINRPEVRNAFRAKTVDELIAAFRAAWGDPEVGVVVLTGAGDKAFSAGGDQRERTGGGYTGGTGLGMDMHGLHGVIRAIPKPVIAMVNGYAIGGGHVLHVLCDLTIAADTAVFGQPGPRVGSVEPGFRTAYPASASRGDDHFLERDQNRVALDLHLVALDALALVHGVAAGGHVVLPAVPRAGDDRSL